MEPNNFIKSPKLKILGRAFELEENYYIFNINYLRANDVLEDKYGNIYHVISDAHPFICDGKLSFLNKVEPEIKEWENNVFFRACSAMPADPNQNI